MMRTTWIAAATIAALASTVFGQTDEDTTAPPSDEPTSLELSLTAGVWMPRLNGSCRLGSSAGSVSLESEFNLDDREATFNGEAVLTIDHNWQVLLGGFDFSTETTDAFRGADRFGGLTLLDGDRYRASLDLWSVGAEGIVPLLEPIGSLAGPAPGERAAITFSGHLGLRYVDVDQTVELIGEGREAADGQWLVPYGGIGVHLRYDSEDEIPLIQRLDIGASGALGPALGGDGGFMWQVRADVTAYVSPQIGLTFGYRLLQLDAEDGNYEFDGGLQGLFFGGTVRF